MNLTGPFVVAIVVPLVLVGILIGFNRALPVVFRYRFAVLLACGILQVLVLVFEHLPRSSLGTCVLAFNRRGSGVLLLGVSRAREQTCSLTSPWRFTSARTNVQPNSALERTSAALVGYLAQASSGPKPLSLKR